MHIHAVAPNTSQSRRQVIRAILEGNAIASQEELLDALSEQGVKTTQPVLSRDLRALGVAKRGGLYQLLQEDRVTPLGALQSMLRGTAQAGANLIVVLCEPGSGQRRREGPGSRGDRGSARNGGGRRHGLRRGLERLRRGSRAGERGGSPVTGPE